MMSKHRDPLKDQIFYYLKFVCSLKIAQGNNNLVFIK